MKKTINTNDIENFPDYQELKGKANLLDKIKDDNKKRVESFKDRNKGILKLLVSTLVSISIVDKVQAIRKAYGSWEQFLKRIIELNDKGYFKRGEL